MNIAVYGYWNLGTKTNSKSAAAGRSRYDEDSWSDFNVRAARFCSGLRTINTLNRYFKFLYFRVNILKVSSVLNCNYGGSIARTLL